MSKKTRALTFGAMIAAAYVALTYLQNTLVPNSASFAIQFRVSEALYGTSLYIKRARLP